MNATDVRRANDLLDERDELKRRLAILDDTGSHLMLNVYDESGDELIDDLTLDDDMAARVRATLLDLVAWKIAGIETALAALGVSIDETEAPATEAPTS